MAQLDSVEIKERLQKAFPKFKFSVTRSVYAGGHSVSVRILSGNIKAMKDDSESYVSGLEYSRESDKLTSEMNAFLNKVRDVIDQVGSYNSRHGSSYLSLSLGTYSKPYVQTSRSSSSTFTPQSRGNSRSNFDYGDRIGSGHGWDLYKKFIADKDVNVYNLVKKPETKPNREKWDEIKGLLLTQEAFKWNPRGQTFQRWYKQDLTEVSINNLFRILGQFYEGGEQEVTPMPTPEPTQQPQNNGIIRDITDQEARDFADAIMESDTINFERVGANSTYDIYMYEDVQKKYVQHMGISLRMLLDSNDFKYILSDIKVSSLKKVYDIIEDENYHVLNNFLSLYGFYGAEKEREAILEYQQYPTKSLKPFKNEPEAPTQTPTNKDRFEPNDRFNFLGAVDSDVVWVVDRLEDENVFIYREGRERSSSWNWTPIEQGKEFIRDGMIRFLEPLSSSEPTPTQTTSTTPHNEDINIKVGSIFIFRTNNNIQIVESRTPDIIKTAFYDYSTGKKMEIAFKKSYWTQKIREGEVDLVNTLEEGDIFQYNDSDTYYKITNYDEKEKNYSYDVLDGKGEVLDSFIMFDKVFFTLLTNNPFKWVSVYPFSQPQENKKEKLEKAIKGLQYLADKGNEKAVKAIKGLKYLLNK